MYYDKPMTDYFRYGPITDTDSISYSVYFLVSDSKMSIFSIVMSIIKARNDIIDTFTCITVLVLMANND